MFGKLWIIALLLIFMLSACGQATPPPTATATEIPPTSTSTPEAGIFTYEQALPLFSYDSSGAFDLYVSSEKENDGVIVQEIAYLAADAKYTSKTVGKILAYLVKPAKSGSYAGILYQHSLGPNGNRKEFLDEATTLAHHGVVSLLPMGIFPWMVLHTGIGESDQLNVAKQIIELRRSLDFLLAQPGIDPQRIAFVGHDYGAMHGAVLSGVEKRIKTYVLMTGDKDYSTWAAAYFLKPANPDRYNRLMLAVSPLTYLPHAAPSSLLLQFAGNDGFVPKDSADQSFASASEPKKFDWYERAGHSLDDQARQGRLDWLTTQLDLKPIR